MKPTRALAGARSRSRDCRCLPISLAPSAVQGVPAPDRRFGEGVSIWSALVDTAKGSGFTPTPLLLVCLTNTVKNPVTEPEVHVEHLLQRDLFLSLCCFPLIVIPATVQLDQAELSDLRRHQFI